MGPGLEVWLDHPELSSCFSCIEVKLMRENLLETDERPVRWEETQMNEMYRQPDEEGVQGRKSVSFSSHGEYRLRIDHLTI